MADPKISIALTAQDDASTKISALTSELGQMQEQLLASQAQVAAGQKDWLDYANQLGATAESMTNVVSGIEDIAIKSAEIATAVAVYQKWKSIVDAVNSSYRVLTETISAATAAAGAAGSTAFDTVSAQALKLDARVGSLAARFLDFEKIATGLSYVGIVLGLAQIAESAHDSNEQTRALTEQIGELTKSMQQLDPASAPVTTAKERFEELYKASLALHEEMPGLIDQYKAFFDTTKSGNLSVQESGRLLTDFNQVMKSLRASSTETAAAQDTLTEALDKGLVTTPKLSQIFGAAFLPALDSVAKSMGITRDQLKELIDTGQVGSDKILPAFAAAARSVTKPLNDVGASAEFSKQQFAAMGETFYSLSDKTLPGVNAALQHTATEIANTVDASVDPIGAAVEQIENFGSRIAEWARLTKQSIIEALASPDYARDIKTGLQEAVYGLDFLLVGLKEEVTATGESLGILAGAAVTATNPIDDLKKVWSDMANRVMSTRDHLDEYVNALEGVDNAQQRTQTGAAALTQALKTLPEIKLPQELQDIVDKLNQTTSASSAVGAVWKELGQLDFTGNSIRNLLLLRQSIDEVSSRTKDASGTQEAFSKQLAEIPIDRLNELVAKVSALSPRLKEVGDSGALMNVALGAVFQKLGLDALEAGGKATKYGQDAAAAFRTIALSAETTSAQVKAALDAALDAAKTQADVALITAAFNELAKSGQAGQQLIADGSAAILRKMAEMNEKVPGVADAFKTLGVESSAHLRDIANAAEASFKQLVIGKAIASDLQDAFLAWARAEVEAATQAGSVIPATLRQQAAALGLSDALDQIISHYQRLNPEQQANIQATGKVAAAAKSYVSALAEVRDAQLSGLQVEIDTLRQKGLTFEAQQKSIELAQQERGWAITLAEAKKMEMQAELAFAQSQLAQLQGSQNQTEATKLQISAITLHIQALTQQLVVQDELIKQQKLLNGQSSVADIQKWIDAIKNKTDATDQDAGATNKLTDAQKAHNLEVEDGKDIASAFAQVLASQIQYWKDETAKLSDATKALFEYKAGLSSIDPQFAAQTFGGVSAEVVKTQAEIQRLTKYTLDMRQMMLEAPGDIARLFASINAAGADAQKSYYEQKLAAEHLEAQIKKVGETGGSSFANVAAAMEFLNGQAQTTTNSFWLLNEQDLSRLKDSISKAKDELKAMQDAAQSARDRLAELAIERANTEGDTAKADKLRLALEEEQSLREANQKLQEAQNAGDRETIALIQQEIRETQSLYDLKAKKLTADTKTSTATPTDPTATPTASAAGLSGKTYTLNLTAGGQTLTTTATSNPSSFLDALEASRLRTT